jgi:multiple sugar transport system substrate-binding protein
MDPVDLHAELILGDGLRDGSYDLALVLTDWLPEAIANGAIRDLSPEFVSAPPADWPEGWSSSMRELQVVDTATYGVAYHDGPMVLMYRGDLFEDPHERNGFRAATGSELVPPETWQEFVQVAKWFTRPDDGLWGATVAGYPDDHNNVYDFLLLLWSAGGEFLGDGATRAAFGGSAGRWALQYYRDLYHLHHVVSPMCLSHESVASGDYYAAGHAAMMWNWIGFSAVTELPPSCIAGANRVTLVPRMEGRAGTHSTLNVYWVMAMAAGTKHPDLAWRFLRHLATPEMDLVTTLAGGNGTRLSTWNDPGVQQRFPHYAVLERAHEGARTLPAIAEFPAIATVVGEMTRSVLHDDRDVDAALADAAASVDTILSAGPRS